MFSNPAQRRPALGQVAQIGALYDARRDSFIPLSLLKSTPPLSSVIVTGDNTSDVKASFTDTYEEKFDKMNLDPELGASFLSGLVHVDRSGGYLNDLRDTNNTIQASLHYNVSTVHEKLNLVDPSLTQCLNLDVLQGTSATHVVTEISWGALTVLVAKHPLTGQYSRSEIEGNFRARFAILESIVEDGDAGYISKDGSDPDTSVNIYSDVMTKDSSVPTDFNDAFQFISNVPRYIAETNGGKGQPTTYVLLPLSFLSYFFPIATCPTITPLSAKCLSQFVQLFEDLRNGFQKLNDYISVLRRQRFCVPSHHVEAVTQSYRAAIQAKHELKSTYSNLLISVRDGASDIEQMWSLLQGVRDGEYSPDKLSSIIVEYEEKMQFTDMVTSRGGRYVPFTSDRLWCNFDHTDTYVLFYFNEVARGDPELWQGNSKLMLDLLDSKREDCDIVICDCDSNGPSEKELKITHYRKREVLVNDLLRDEKISLTQCDKRYIGRDDRPKPQRRRAVKIPCPGPNCASDSPNEWFCAKCRTPIEFGDDGQYLYCDCGYGHYNGYSFKCKDAVHHGSSFEKFRGTDLLRLLQGLEPYRELNILILGETGVGKSTFINAFINYLTFETLDEAIEYENLQWIIPCSFSTQYLDKEGKFHQEDIKIGQSTYENDGSRGESATQSTTVYRIQMGNMVVRLIDTPGIGDTRGIHQDKKNMADILSTLASFESLHGILILLKPNSARLTLMFKFCVTELLTHLHRDAAENMVFGFTSTRVSNYMPGDAFEPLQSLLQRYRGVQMSLTRENTYCFDSESFRFLAALKQTGRPMDNEDDFRRSWKRSEEESRRLLAHFRSLEPHLVKGTLSLNRARDLITTLTKPMAEIMDVINTTIRINEDHLRELADERCKGDALKKHLHFQKVNKVTKPLDKPRTVCTLATCVDYIPDVHGTKPVYKTHCHKVCYLSEVPKEVPGNIALKHCAAFSGGKCTLCKHDWKSHQHVQYELENKMTTERDLKVEEKLKIHESEIEAKEAAIKVFRLKIDEARQELKELEDAAAQFGLFLRMNSITAYNDEMLAYLDEQIKEARQTVNATRLSKGRLDGLERTRKEYEQQIRVLEKEMAAGDMRKPPDERDVEKLVQKLFRMKCWGQNLKDIKTTTDYYGSSKYRERLFRAPRDWHTALPAPGGYPTSMPFRPMGEKADSGSYSQPDGQLYGQSHDQPPAYSSLIPSSDDLTSQDTSAFRPRASRLGRVTMPEDTILEVEPSSLKKLRSRLRFWKDSK
ncbi:MAG: hypothetical protein M1839_006692 [Geoglossum umbratile]|nr:MAG: hypothetical protein M1839_006692 [Geoglossum umbratile]